MVAAGKLAVAMDRLAVDGILVRDATWAGKVIPSMARGEGSLAPTF
jgi:hypothetical protein